MRLIFQRIYRIRIRPYWFLPAPFACAVFGIWYSIFFERHVFCRARTNCKCTHLIFCPCQIIRWNMFSVQISFLLECTHVCMHIYLCSMISDAKNVIYWFRTECRMPNCLSCLNSKIWSICQCWNGWAGTTAAKYRRETNWKHKSPDNWEAPRNAVRYLHPGLCDENMLA